MNYTGGKKNEIKQFVLRLRNLSKFRTLYFHLANWDINRLKYFNYELSFKCKYMVHSLSSVFIYSFFSGLDLFYVGNILKMYL